MAIGPCQACHHVDRLAPSTDDCACQVCNDCGSHFLDQGQCGICGIAFTEDELWGDEPPA